MNFLSILLFSAVFMGSGMQYEEAEVSICSPLASDMQVIVDSSEPCSNGNYAVSGYVQQVSFDSGVFEVRAVANFKVDCDGNVTLSEYNIMDDSIDTEQFSDDATDAVLTYWNNL